MNDTLKGKEPIMLQKTAPGGVIFEIEPDSPAAEAGLHPGDRIMSINGRPLWDVLDYQFYSSDMQVELIVERGEERWSLSLDGEEGLGIRFSEPTFDGIRRCSNKCPFCFVHQNPRGARKTLFIKDDDYRYSALYGGFVTLTNLSEEDWLRIGEQHLSPLNVSVHATDPAVRAMLLGNPKAPPIVPQIERLIAMGIRVNSQVVLCPGLNDGQHMHETINSLVRLYPGVETLSIVPVGMTDNGIRKITETRRHTPSEARQVLDEIEPYRKRFRKELGLSFVYPSDEFYLLAEAPIPAARLYDGFPQFSNGVGMVRSLYDELNGLKRRKTPPQSRFKSATVFTGTLAAPVLGPVLREVGGIIGGSIEVRATVNRYFGPSVTVAGLLTGQDFLAAALEAQADGGENGGLGEVVVLPRYSLDVLGGRFLDDITPRELSESLGREIVFASTIAELLDVLR